MKFIFLVILMALTSCGKSGTIIAPDKPSSTTDTQVGVPSEPVAVPPVTPPNYSYVDPNKVIAPKLLKTALDYYAANLTKIKNKNFLSVVDFTLYAGKARFFVIDMKTGAVKALHVSHGAGSDPSGTGYAKIFSNTPGTNASSLGIYQTAETYVGKHGLSLKMDGLSSTNSKVRARAIVIHAADYVTETGKAGRSWGCFAFSPESISYVITNLKGGSIIYAGLE